MDEGNTDFKDKTSAIPAWSMILIMLGMAALLLGVIVSNTSPINFAEERGDDQSYDDYQNESQLEEDLSAMQYLVGAIFINFGIGLILISLVTGIIANDTIDSKSRVMVMLITGTIFSLWIYFSLLSGLLSKMTWLHP